MKVALATYGTRGDVQPFVCLGAELRRRGHEVTLLTPRNGAAMARAAGLSVLELPCDIQEMFGRPAAQRMLAAGRIGHFFRWLRAEERSYGEALRATLIAGCRGADVLVSHALLEDRADALAEAAGIPHVAVHFWPTPPTAELPSPFLAQRSLGPLNRPSHRLVLEMLWRFSKQEAAAMRRELGLPRARRSFSQRLARGEGGSLLLAYSATISPPPGDWAGASPIGAFAISPDLRRRIGEWGVPPELERWIADGPAPVFLGFGSMPVLDREGLLEDARAVLEEVGSRAILGAGWSELGEIRDASIFSLETVDHASVLPRCAAAVHHGGAGTVHASLGAGVPTVVCSVYADQAYWGARCRALGVGESLRFRDLSRARLAVSLRRALDAAVTRRAASLGVAIRSERGLQRAADAIGLAHAAGDGSVRRC